MPDLPAGTVTFVFTDIEGSTRMLQHLGDADAVRVFADHRRLLRAAIAAGGGRELSDQGDGFLMVFSDARSAVLAAVAAQRVLAEHPWPQDVDMRVRMGLHTGDPITTEDGYIGIDIHRAARISQVAWGGQIIVSHRTQELLEDELPEGMGLRDLGQHRLKDLQRPERIFQILGPGLPADFPPLRSLDPKLTNLPTQYSSFIGRAREMIQIKELLAR
jgi:class 3 adenylate cyclase